MSHLEKKRYAAGKGGDKSADGKLWAEPPAKPNNTASYFFLAAFSAAFVTLPDVKSFCVTDLITPTATVCLMSRTAKRPKGGNSENDSTHNGLDGTKLTIAASPD